jgi:hypothetical protein
MYKYLPAQLIVILCIAAGLTARPAPSGISGSSEVDPPRLIPSPVTIDQIVHDFGNIATTVDNWGYIGGYDFYGMPSGEWPRGSKHHYLAELKYWMGAIIGVDTLVADTYEDFQGMPDSVNGGEAYTILLSTDSSRYFNYDPTDTVGSGLGNPAQGWKVWNPDSNAWTYNQVYNSRDTQLVAGNWTHFFPGGPTSLQESHYRFNDAAQGSPLLGLEMTQTVLQWNYCYNEDLMYVVLEIKNTSGVDLTNFAFGLYVDLDVGANEQAGQNGQTDDLVGSDSTENLAWIYDADGYDPGWGSETGMMGTKFIETPQGIGMTSFRTGDWALVPDNDPGKYEMIDGTAYDGTIPPADQYYVQCTRGINLLADSTLRVVFAIISGADETAFRANSAMAQTLYDSYFVGPQPPTTPYVSVTAGDSKNYVRWTDTSEVGVDPLTGVNDFRGYKLYRSDNKGKTWGAIDYSNRNDCLDIDYKPLAKFPAGIPGDPMPHTFIDTGLSNGVEYWYCLSAYDAGEPGLVDALQSGFGSPNSARNVSAGTPRTDPAGYFASAGTVEHKALTIQLPSDGSINPIVFDRALLTSSDYKVAFTDAPDQTYWHLINVSTGDTLLKDQTMENADPNLYSVAEGLRVVVNNGDRWPRAYGQTAFVVPDDTTLATSVFYGGIIPLLTGDERDHFGDSKIRANFEIRYTGDTTWAQSIWEGFEATTYPKTPIPLEVWNTTTNQRVSFSNTSRVGTWVPGNTTIIVDYPYDTTNDLTAAAFPYEYGWGFRLSAAVWNPQPGDVFTIEGAPVNGPNDEFVFKADGINATQASAALGRIHTLPDPYFGRYSSRVEDLNGEKVIQFVNLPDKCTIRIYTLAGDLVTTLNHEGFAGTLNWDLLSSDRREISSGVYLYHVESPYGEKLGRMAILK